MTAGFGLPGVVFKGSLADNILLIKKLGFWKKTIDNHH